MIGDLGLELKDFRRGLIAACETEQGLMIGFGGGHGIGGGLFHTLLIEGTGLVKLPGIMVAGGKEEGREKETKGKMWFRRNHGAKIGRKNALSRGERGNSYVEVMKLFCKV